MHVQLRAALESRGPVLLIGAPGTGKRTLARLIHHHSGLSSIPFVELGPAQGRREARLPDFGYLSPVEELSRAEQGGLRNRIGLGRLVLGTRLEPGSPQWRGRMHRRLLSWCTEQIELPSLRERVEDLELLVAKLLVEARHARAIGGISDAALACLRRYDWPGNVTELEAVIHHALDRAEGPLVQLWDLPACVRLRDAATLAPESPTEQYSLLRAERDAIVRALRQARGDKQEAARLLQTSTSTLYRKLARHGL